MMIGVVSCECGADKKSELSGKLSIGFEKEKLSGSYKSTHLIVKLEDGLSYEAGKYKLQVTASNGVVQIGNLKFDSNNTEGSLHVVLGVSEGDKIEEEKKVLVEVTPTDANQPFKATVKLVDGEGEVAGAELNWEPVVQPIKPQVTIGDLGANNKFKVTIQKQGGKLVADDLQGVSIVASYSPATGGASIVEHLQIEAKDINPQGVVEKEFTVLPSLVETEITVTVNLPGVNAVTKKFTIPAAVVKPDYEFKFSPNNIENDREATIVLRRSGKDLDVKEINNLKFKVIEIVGKDATIGGKGQSEDFSLSFTINSSNSKEATATVAINPQGNREVTYKLGLYNGTVKQGGEQTLTWKRTVEVTSKLDAAGKKVTLTVENNGFQKLENLKLKYEKTEGDAKLVGKEKGEIEIKQIDSKGSFNQDLELNFGTALNAKFKFTLVNAKDVKLWEGDFVYSQKECKVAIEAVGDSVTKGEKVKIKIINEGAEELTGLDLESIRIKYGSTNNGKLSLGAFGDIQGKNLKEVLEKLTSKKDKLNSGESVELELQVTGNSDALVDFTDITLEGSKADAAKIKTGKIEWEAANPVKMEVVGSKEVKDGGKIRLKVTNISKKVDLKKEDLEKIQLCFKIKPDNVKLKATIPGRTVGDLKSGINLYNLLNVGLSKGGFMEVVLEVIPSAAGVRRVELTDIELQGSGVKDVDRKIDKITWEEVKLPIKLGAEPTEVKGGGKIKIKLENKGTVDLTKEQLKLIKIEYNSSNNGKLVYSGLFGLSAPQDIKDKTLDKLLTGGIKGMASVELELVVEKDENSSTVEFTNIRLEGSSLIGDEVKIGKITWTAPAVEIHPGEVEDGGKIKLKIKNVGGVPLGRGELGYVHMRYTCVGVKGVEQVKLGVNSVLLQDVNDQPLSKVLSLFSGLGGERLDIAEEKEVELIVSNVPGHVDEVKFKDIQLIGSSASDHTKVEEIVWKKATT
ncbi:MAG: hypothetical protein QXO96_06175 [Sulfolobales archaeon]